MTSAEGLLSWQIGDVTITRVEEAMTGVPCASLVPGITAEHLESHAGWVAPFFTGSGKLLLSNHTFVVKHPDLVAVIDTCVGVIEERPLPGDPGFLARLDAAIDGGLDAVDVVLCTHLHFDHVGWNTRRDDEGRLVPTFASATYLITNDELAAVGEEDHHAVYEPSVAPLGAAGVLRGVDTDHELVEGIRLVPTPGHTPGHVSVLIESRGSSALITGDAFHTPMQIPHPELAATLFDFDSDQSSATRRDLLHRFCDSDTLVLGTHFAPPTAGHIRSRDGDRWFDTAG